MAEINYDLLASQCVTPTKEALPPIGDFHASNAMAFYGREVVEKAYKTDYKQYKEFYRDNAKRNGLALCYGGSWRVLEEGLGVSEAEAKRIHTQFFATLRGFKKHVTETEAKASKDKFTRNLFGRVLHLPDLGNKTEWKFHNDSLRKMFNYPIQSISADLIKLVLLEFVKLSETTDSNVFANNNIHKQYYNRVVATHNPSEGLLQELETLPTGNVLIVIQDPETQEVTQQFDRPLHITKSFIEKHSLQVVF